MHGKLRAAAGLALVLLMATACAAPASRPAGGQVGDQVQAALDGGRLSFDHAAWDDLLAAAVRGDLVDYSVVAARRPDLDRYLENVAAANLASLTPAHLKALLLNAYNALTVRSILDHPGIKSIRDIDGVWTDTRHRVGGFELTLDDIEHTLLRPYFKDPRIHFAVNCASRSCAPLPPWAYDGNRLDGQLEERSRTFLSRQDQVQVRGGGLAVSSYFDWYGQDFTAAGWQPRRQSVGQFIAAYSRSDVAEAVTAAGGTTELTFLDYDWSLNAAAPGAAGGGAGRAPASSGPAPQADTAAAPGPVTRLRDWITGQGAAGAVLYILTYAVLTVLFVPAWPLTVGAGVAYGLVLGTVVVSLGSASGAALAFLVGRYLLRARVEKWIAGSRFAAIDRAVGREGWKIVGLTRLSPAFPFNLLNYAYGLTAVGFWPYFFASWIGMLPGTLLYVYLGAAAGDVANAAASGAGWGKTALQITGVAATLLVTVIITRTARRALRESAGPLERAADRTT